MATIKHKRGTSDPGTSDVAVGELAINTTDGGLFTQTDGGSVVEIGGSSASATDVNVSKGFESAATVPSNWSIGANNNAMFPGPMTVASGVTITVPANRTLTVV